MDSYKIEYNNLLKRYYNGCEFLKKNPEKFDDYFKLLLNIHKKLNIMIEKYNIKDKDVILKGFKE